MGKCYFCGAKLKKEKVDLIRYWGKEPYALNNVPALVCVQCGERYYAAEVSKKIDEIILNQRSSKKPTKTIEIPVSTWP